MLRKGKLKVRRNIWRPLNGSGGSRTEVLEGKRWRPYKNLASAREYARRNGYSGITVEVL